MKRVRIATPFPSVSSTAKTFGISRRRLRELRALAAKLMNRGNNNARVLAFKKRRAANMVRTVDVIKMRKNLGRLLEQVDAKGSQYVIEQGGRPMAAVVPVWQLKEWRARRDRFFARIDASRRRSRKARPQAIAREVAEAVEKTRASVRRRPA